MKNNYTEKEIIELLVFIEIKLLEEYAKNPNKNIKSIINKVRKKHLDIINQKK